MSDLFKSAFGYFSSSNLPSVNNELVGQTVDVNNVKLKIKDVIAEGGFAFVYTAQTLDSSKTYALKRLLGADAETNECILQEINVLKKLTGHPHIIQFISYATVDKSISRHGMTEYLLVTELCQGGSLVNSLQARGNPYPPDIVCSIMWQTCRAVQHMHSQTPPIIHRDLKIENLLISSEGRIKLCDFGSVTCDIFRPDDSWTAQQRALLEDQMCAKTTPMYRAPEMVDTWSNHEIGPACDIWALGCVNYLLCFNKHPFEDSAKLRILNANYSLPLDNKYMAFHSVISGCLVSSPSQRLNICGLLERIASISESTGYNRNQAIPVHRPQPPPQPVTSSREPRNSPVHQPAPVQPHHSPVHNNRNNNVGGSSSGGGLFSQLKGGAGSLLRNLKDTSTKVVQSVQQTMAKGEEMGASYITSRICVINYTDGPETLQDMRCLIESSNRLSNIAIYNLTSTPFPPHRFPNATLVEGGWARGRVPSLQSLYTLCQHMHHFLSSQPSSVVFITCNDGKTNSAMLVCGFLLFVGFVWNPTDAMQLYAVKRSPPVLQPSHLRYLEYFSRVLQASEPTFTINKFQMIAIVLQPIPLYNKIRDGCRPFVEVFVGEDKVFTSIDEYERLKVFSVSHAKVVIPLGCLVSGDVTVSVHHARLVFGRITPIKMFQLQFNTAFIQTGEHSLVYTRGDLDEVGSEESLTVTLSLDIVPNSASVTNAVWAKHTSQHTDPSILFTSKLEADETTENFVPSKDRRSPPARPREPPSRPGEPPSRPGQPPSRPGQAPSRPVQPPNRPIHPPSKPGPPCRPQPPGNLVNSSEDLLNIGTSEEREGLLDLGSSPGGTSPGGAQLIDTMDLLNLADDSQPVYSTTPSNQPVYSTTPSNQSIYSTTPSNQPLFEAFTTEPTPQVGISVSESLLGDWTADTEVLADFSSNTNGLSTHLPPPSNGFIGMNKIHSTGNLKNINSGGGIQRNVSYPNLKTDPFDEFISSQGPKSVSTANSPAKTPNEQPPNYSRTNFESNKQPQPGKKSEDVFGDLLGSQGYSFTSKKDLGPKTINQMRREDQVKIIDPDKLKMNDWIEGKKSNVRALLTTLHTVVWPEAKWTQCHMHQLVSTADVKKAYRRACIAVHPDKHIGTENEKIAKMIFMELNNAWSEFEKENH